jgi:hypothetical protein
MVWETFTRTRWRNPTDPTVTVTSTGRLSLNVAVINNFVEDNKFAILMFDRSRKLVGIKFAKSSDSTTYPIFINRVKSSAAINCQAFLKNYSLIPEKTSNYEASYDKKSKLLTFSIEK